MSTFSSTNVTDGNLLLKERTHTINNKIQLHILGVTPNKLGNWLIVHQNLFSFSRTVITFVCKSKNNKSFDKKTEINSLCLLYV